MPFGGFFDYISIWEISQGGGGFQDIVFLAEKISSELYQMLGRYRVAIPAPFAFGVLGDCRYSLPTMGGAVGSAGAATIRQRLGVLSGLYPVPRIWAAVGSVGAVGCVALLRAVLWLCCGGVVAVLRQSPLLPYPVSVFFFLFLAFLFFMLDCFGGCRPICVFKEVIRMFIWLVGAGFVISFLINFTHISLTSCFRILED